MAVFFYTFRAMKWCEDAHLCVSPGLNIYRPLRIHSYGEAVGLQSYLLICRSITHAQRMNAVLQSAGVSGRIFRPPVGLTEKGCSYAIRIGAPYFAQAMRHLRLAQLLPERVFISADNGGYREIVP